MVKDILRERKFHGRQASDERLYMRREEGERGLMSFKDVYACTKARVACYMAASAGYIFYKTRVKGNLRDYLTRSYFKNLISNNISFYVAKTYYECKDLLT